jgi:hypothetical protein
MRNAEMFIQQPRSSEKPGPERTPPPRGPLRLYHLSQRVSIKTGFEGRRGCNFRESMGLHVVKKVTDSEIA